MCKRTKFAKLPLLGLLTLLVSVTPNKFISLSLKPFHSHFSISEGASAGRGRVPVCAPLGGCSAQRALAGRLVGTPIDMAVEMRWNFFQGRKLMQLGLVDWRLSSRD